MKKIQWEPKGSRDSVYATVGSVKMHCYVHYTQMGIKRWYANVSIMHRAATSRYGIKRKSMNKAKEDAVRMARELLLDYRAGVEKELANFED